MTSIGYNPYFKNEKKTIEPHIMHQFDADFYGEHLKLVLCGYIRPELDFVSMEALTSWIKNDIEVASTALDQEKYLKFKTSI